MARIAIAGGLGDVGKTFTDAFKDTNHKVMILTRKAVSPSNGEIRQIQVDYSSVAQITGLLEHERIDTIISALNMIDEAASQAQLNLIAAAEQSRVTRRFIPSEYGVLVTEETAKIDPYAPCILASAKALSKTSLQYSRISTGFFMDYWGQPLIDSRMTPINWALNIEKALAVIPGTGEDKFSMVYTRDLARFIVRLLDETDWPVEAAVVGQDLSLNQALKWMEQATDRKFTAEHDSAERLQSGKVTPLDQPFDSPAEEAYNASFGHLVVKGLMLLPDHEGYRLNHRFPELKALTVEEMLQRTWGSQ